MSLRALLYRRPSEPSVIPIVFDRAVYLVRLRRHRQARRYTLRIDAASRAVVLTMPPRGSLKEAREFAQKHGARAAYSQLGELLADSRVDGVFVCSPNALHAEHVVQAASAGKHVLCEKPIAVSLD